MDGKSGGEWMGRWMGGWVEGWVGGWVMKGEVFAVSFGKYLSVHNLVLYLGNLLSFSLKVFFFYSYFK